MNQFQSQEILMLTISVKNFLCHSLDRCAKTLQSIYSVDSKDKERHSSVDSNCGPSYINMKSGSWVPTFQRNMLLPSELKHVTY
jgi:hypothetical protein